MFFDIHCENIDCYLIVSAFRYDKIGISLARLYKLLIALVLLCSVMGCRGNHNAAAEQEEAVDLQQIKDNGELVVLTLYSSTSFNGLTRLPVRCTMT